MMQKAKTEDTFIRDIKTTPEPAIVACTDRQLDDLVRFVLLLQVITVAS